MQHAQKKWNPMTVGKGGGGGGGEVRCASRGAIVLSLVWVCLRRSFSVHANKTARWRRTAPLERFAHDNDYRQGIPNPTDLCSYGMYTSCEFFKAVAKVDT